MKFCFLQISNNLINPPKGTLPEKFYDTFWQNKREDGYYRPEHFWELPTWIAEIAYTLPDTVERDLHIVENNRHLPKSDYYLFSVLDVNKRIIEHIVQANPDKKFILGGYCCPYDKDIFWPKNVFWFDAISSFCDWFGFDYKYGTDYSLFAGTECIPRLTLSTGCKHRCKFCTVPNDLCEKTYYEAIKQIWSFESLKFKLIYLNDKTYGQAENYMELHHLYKVVKQYNPAFEGFIVQTTAVKVNELPVTIWQDNHIKVVEIGVETYNDDLLRQYRKPVRECDIERAVLDLNNIGVKVIANIILGLPGETNETYSDTYGFLWWSTLLQKRIYSLNIYTLAAYADSDLGIEAGADDTDELNDNRTFWTDAEREAYHVWSDKFYQLGLEIVG